MKTTHYFFTIRTIGRKPLLGRYKGLEQIAEQGWKQLFDNPQPLDSKDFSTRRDSLSALITAPAEAENVEEAIEARVEAFREGTQQSWEAFAEARELPFEGEIWQDSYELRLIRSEEELKEIKEYILQNLLGGGLYDGWDDDW